MPKTYFILLLTILSISCKKETTTIEAPKEAKKIQSAPINTNTKSIDDDFKSFLDAFSKDSVFQVSRVTFPFVLEEWIDPETGTEKKLIDKKTYETIDFRYPKDALTREYDRYTQTIKFKDNKAVVEIRGVDNGIYANYIFEKINGKWLLISCNNQSI
ncbi:DUF4348 domain-containing protein [Flavobacterium columnare]|uniref:DUF4348 domain-containing protein n=1 Tax=Flavobacterium columnare TaxID=996 RepID=A0A437U9I7_9FLAO|nr:DUF4348 domain-containing protein [Flavobacterium columnare]RVU90273.1 DUF4348 domain-containing protein [Flavobacterium columnare]